MEVDRSVSQVARRAVRTVWEHPVYSFLVFVFVCTVATVVMDEWNYAEVSTNEARGAEAVFGDLKQAAQKHPHILEGITAMERQNKLDANSGVRFNAVRGVARRFSLAVVRQFLDRAYDALGPFGTAAAMIGLGFGVWILMRMSAAEEMQRQMMAALRQKQV